MSSIGRYRVVRRLGAGAFSTVWLGHDDDLDVPVAIKVLAENWVGHADIGQRFLEEARLLRRMEDRRVVRVHDIGRQDDGRPYFVMDHVEGGTLADLTDLPLPATEALALGRQLAEAVQVLHTHGVLHRDVKPGNVLLTGGTARRVVVADLGMAKRLAESSGVTMTVGTPAFMAPEQANGRSGLDVRVDVYGVAAVIYLLLTGRTPFPDARTVSEVALRDRSAAPRAVSEGPPGIDPLLQSALAGDPDQRPATAQALADRLARLQTRAEGGDTTVRRGQRPQTGLTRRAAAALATAVVLLVGALTWITLSALIGG